LNRWLVDHALASQRADLARTYIVLSGEEIAAYVSLTTGSIRRGLARGRYTRGMVPQGQRHPSFPRGPVITAQYGTRHEKGPERLALSAAA
jgi:hypothetical protein